MNVIGYSVSNFVVFSRIEVLWGDGSVNVYEVFSILFWCCVWLRDDDVNVLIVMKDCGFYVSG